MSIGCSVIKRITRDPWKFETVSCQNDWVYPASDMAIASIWMTSLIANDEESSKLPMLFTVSFLFSSMVGWTKYIDCDYTNRSKI